MESVGCNILEYPDYIFVVTYKGTQQPDAALPHSDFLVSRLETSAGEHVPNETAPARLSP